jgi:RHS repeat-associated protein
VGSVRVVFTATGQVIGRSDYLPFGDTLNQSGALPKQRFTGQERDGEAGLDYFNARSLQMRTGRMSSPDPLFGNALVNPQRWNRYTYALNNPLRFTDPTGMDAYDNSNTQRINEFYQQVWGLQAWDDFSQDYWAQGTAYSYGPFSPRELYNSAFTPRDGGGAGDVTTSYYISIPGLLPSRPLPQTAAPPGPDRFTDPTTKALALRTLTAPDVTQMARKYPQNEIFGAICRCKESGAVYARVELAMAGEAALRCPLDSSKIADLHRHPLVFGNPVPTPGEGEVGMPNFVWTPYNGGVVWQYNQSGFWGAWGPTPPGFFRF